MKLSRLPIGSTATILSVGGSGALRQHFLDMGLIQGTEVTVVKYAPMGDPIELRIHGYEPTSRWMYRRNHRKQKNIIRAMEREENSITGRRKILCRRERP